MKIDPNNSTIHKRSDCNPVSHVEAERHYTRVAFPRYLGYLRPG